MKILVRSLILVSVVLASGCSDDPLPEEELEVPQDLLAFYTIEGFHGILDLNTVTLDSIMSFTEKFLEYQDIASYDTSSYEFKITGVSKANLDPLMAGNVWPKPVAAVSEGSVLFFADVRSPVSSSFPGYYYFEILSFPSDTEGRLEFCIPPSGLTPGGQDPRMNPTMLQILSNGNKILD